MKTVGELTPFIPPKRQPLIGRDSEITTLKNISTESAPAIITIYGRRRVGKAALIETVFKDRNIIKFEGDEFLDEVGQIKNCLEQLSRYAKDPKISSLNYVTWREFFLLIWEYIKTGTWTVYFEELQWLTRYKSSMISELKYIWDNYYQGNPKMLLVLCGSSPSFMINKVIRSRSLYNRSQHEIALKPLKVSNIGKLLTFKTDKQIFETYLMVGGVPEYLKYMRGESTAARCIAKHSFNDSCFFLNEYERVFISSLSKNKHYKRILEFIAVNYSCSADVLASGLKLTKTGTFKRILQDLELCGFITKVTPFDARTNTTLVKYEIADNYLHFYYSFIKPIEKRIRRGDYKDSLYSVLKPARLHQWLGYAFERYLRQNPTAIAKIMEFNGIEYECGAYFNRSAKDLKFQIDLAYLRKDRVLTVCEVKYTESPVGVSVIDEVEEKLSCIRKELLHKYELQKVLVSKERASSELLDQGYFDRVILMSEIMGYGV